MPARSTRQEARARILAAFAAQLDRMIPEDEDVALKGATFADFEDQAEALAGGSGAAVGGSGGPTVPTPNPQPPTPKPAMRAGEGAGRDEGR
jgi:hypothetical protein